MYSVWERVKKGPFSHTVHIFVKIIIFLFNSRWSKVLNGTIWEFTLKHANMFLKNNFRLKGLQIKAFQQHYLKCWRETPYWEGELVPKTCKNWKFSGLVTKLENLFVFGKTLWKISSNWWFQEKLQNDLTLAPTFKVCYNTSHFCKLLSLYLDERMAVHGNTSMRLREFPRAQTEGTPKTKCWYFLYSQTWVKVQTLSWINWICLRKCTW